MLHAPSAATIMCLSDALNAESSFKENDKDDCGLVLLEETAKILDVGRFQTSNSHSLF